MGIPQFFERWFWAAGIYAVALTGLLMFLNIRGKIRKDPGFGPGYRQIILRFLFSGIVPFLVMGLGIETGKVALVYQFLEIRKLNTFVLFFWFSVLAVWAVQTVWIFFQGGAETLARHPGLLKFRGLRFFSDITEPSTYKFVWILMTQALLFVVIVLALIPAS